MTPAPISVERLPEKWRRPPTKAGVEWIEANARRQCAYELERALPALLQQLAERDAEINRIQNAWCVQVAELHERLDAAERAREEAQKAVIAAIPTNWCDPLLTGPNAVIRGSGEYNGLDIERLLLAIQQRVVAAFIAASGVNRHA